VADANIDGRKPAVLSMANLGAEMLQPLGERSRRPSFRASQFPWPGTISIAYKALSKLWFLRAWASSATARELRMSFSCHPPLLGRLAVGAGRVNILQLFFDIT
jgi:hypothetical protein